MAVLERAGKTEFVDFADCDVQVSANGLKVTGTSLRRVLSEKLKDQQKVTHATLSLGGNEIEGNKSYPKEDLAGTALYDADGQLADDATEKALRIGAVVFRADMCSC